MDPDFASTPIPADVGIGDRRSIPIPAGAGVDGWRPLGVQQFLYHSSRDRICTENPELSTAGLERLVTAFVSAPSADPGQPSPHLTGGAVDLTIVDADGNPLDMRTAFDDFTAEAHTRYLEELERERLAQGEELSAHERRQQQNRRMLFHLMTACGFTNYPLEWWHFDYGNQFWAKAGGAGQAVYLQTSLNCRLDSSRCGSKPR